MEVLGANMGVGDNVTPVGSRSDPVGGSEPKSEARYYLYYILGLSLTYSFSELYLYLKYTNNFCNNKNHLHIQKNYHRSGVYKNLYTYTESHLLIYVQFLLQNIRDCESSAGEHLSLSRLALLMWNVLSSSLLFGTYTD